MSASSRHPFRSTAVQLPCHCSHSYIYGSEHFRTDAILACNCTNAESDHFALKFRSELTHLFFGHFYFAIALPSGQRTPPGIGFSPPFCEYPPTTRHWITLRDPRDHIRVFSPRLTHRTLFFCALLSLLISYFFSRCLRLIIPAETAPADCRTPRPPIPVLCTRRSPSAIPSEAEIILGQRR